MSSPFGFYCMKQSSCTIGTFVGKIIHHRVAGPIFTACWVAIPLLGEFYRRFGMPSDLKGLLGHFRQSIGWCSAVRGRAGRSKVKGVERAELGGLREREQEMRGAD